MFLTYNAGVTQADGRKSAILCIHVGQVAATENRVHADVTGAV